MLWTTITAPKPRHFTITGFTSRDILTNQPVSGFYLNYYIDNFSIRDDLQDTPQRAMAQALTSYNVPTHAWKQLSVSPERWVADNLPPQPFVFSIAEDKSGKGRLQIRLGTDILFEGARGSLDAIKGFSFKNFGITATSWKQDA